jgi:biopolymer transport protein TolR
MEALRGDDTVMAEINITPFTDVLLVLLIIFMILAALVAPPGFEQRLADPGGGVALPSPARTIDIVVERDGAISIDGRPTRAARIYEDVRRVAAVRGRLHVSLAADVQAPYGTILRVLDAAKIAGLRDVGFVSGEAR